MIESASFRNFKSLRHVDVHFERLTVFVGPNASGKTSILEGLYYLSQVISIEPSKFFSGSRDPLFLYSRGITKEDMELSCENDDLALRLKVTPPLFAPDDMLHPDPSDSLGSGWDFRVEYNRPRDPGAGWVPVSEHLPILTDFRSSNLLRLEARRLAEASYSDLPRASVESDGAGMASVLAFMALNKPDKFASLQERIRSVIPPVKRIRFDRVPVIKFETEVVTIDSDRLTRRIKREFLGDEVVFDFEGASDIPAHLASEGTILVLGLLTALLGPARPKFFLLDDIDHGLHPKAQRKIIPLIRTILEENSDLQIIATTHSPYIVDELEANEVRITWAGEDGATQCGHLDSHPDFDRWKDEMWPGEFWSLVGEQWVANGQGVEKS